MTKTADQQDQLLAFILHVRQRYPQLKSYNPHKADFQLPKTVYDERTEALFDQLVHCMTVINQLYRVNRGEEELQSSYEDMLAAVAWMEHLLNPALAMSRSALTAYQKLCQQLSPKAVFTARQLREWTGYSKTQSHRILAELGQLKLIQKLGGHKNRGYYYELKKTVELPVLPKESQRKAQFVPLEEYRWLS